MNATQRQPISKDSEVILKFLFGTKSPLDRHKRAVRDGCHLTSEPQRAERAFRELIDTGLLRDAGEGCLELTETGLQKAHDLKKASAQPRTVINQHVGLVDQGGSVIMAGTQDNATPLSYEQVIHNSHTGSLRTAEPVRRKIDPEEEREIERTLRTVLPDLPSINEHPLRNGLPEMPAVRGGKSMQPRNVAVRYILVFDHYKDVLPIPIVHGDVVGRSKKGTIMLRHDEYISNRHCRFELVADRSSHRMLLYVEDLGSKNGTFIDEVEVFDGKAQLYHGARLRVGNTVFVVIEVP